MGQFYTGDEIVTTIVNLEAFIGDMCADIMQITEGKGILLPFLGGSHLPIRAIKFKGYRPLKAEVVNRLVMGCNMQVRYEVFDREAMFSYGNIKCVRQNDGALHLSYKLTA